MRRPAIGNALPKRPLHPKPLRSGCPGGPFLPSKSTRSVIPSGACACA
jgi:hypothetical protein